MESHILCKGINTFFPVFIHLRPIAMKPVTSDAYKLYWGTASFMKSAQWETYLRAETRCTVFSVFLLRL